MFIDPDHQVAVLRSAGAEGKPSVGTESRLRWDARVVLQDRVGAAQFAVEAPDSVQFFLGHTHSSGGIKLAVISELVVRRSHELAS